MGRYAPCLRVPLGAWFLGCDLLSKGGGGSRCISQGGGLGAPPHPLGKDGVDLGWGTKKRRLNEMVCPVFEGSTRCMVSGVRLT